jgi:hypothetical protein
MLHEIDADDSIGIPLITVITEEKEILIKQTFANIDDAIYVSEKQVADLVDILIEYQNRSNK